jgi:hypothetical protein
LTILSQEQENWPQLDSTDTAVSLPGYKEHMFSEISFASRKNSARIQVADLLAREAMKALDNFIGPIKRQPRKSWLVLSDEFFESLDRQKEELMKRFNQSQTGYDEWLRKTNRQNNLTNLFIYSNLCLENRRK